MKKQMLTTILMFLFLTGCHTIRPVAAPTGTLISDVSPLNRNVGLIMDSGYTGFVSKDRGNPMADPQKYLVGEALAPLTLAYFQKAALAVKSYSTLDQAKSEGHADLYVYPKITGFENTIRLGGQRIDAMLSSAVYDRTMNLLETVEGRGMSTGGISADPDNTVSTALQLALLDLIKNIQTVEPKSS